MPTCGAVNAYSRLGTLVTVLLLLRVAPSTMPRALAEQSWDRAAAAQYLDARAALWNDEARARRNLPTACVSCHTALPYMLSRAALGGSATPPPARDLFSDVETRVATWATARASYEEKVGPEKPAQSFGTESILNALVLTSRDRRAGRPLSSEARAALQNMWAQQTAAGNWEWLHFGLLPWESDGSNYWGAALAAVASMSVASEAVPPAEPAAKLRTYLRDGLASQHDLHNRLALLWAASALDGLLSHTETASLVADIAAGQQPDGGYPPRKLVAWSPEGASDAYTTAFATFVLQQMTGPRPSEAIAGGLAWLAHNQQPDGRWNALSVNKDRSEQDAFRRLLMSDAATGFAVLALTASGQ